MFVQSSRRSASLICYDSSGYSEQKEHLSDIFEYLSTEQQEERFTDMLVAATASSRSGYLICIIEYFSTEIL
jgi:pyrroline-5-carboxylate reductase